MEPHRGDAHFSVVALDAVGAPHLDVDPVLQLMWAVANGEACRSGSRQIEPVHFLLAVLKIADHAAGRDAEMISLPSHVRQALPWAAAACRAALGMTDRQITASRRALSAELRKGDGQNQVRRLDRSEEAHELFHRASVRAAATSSGVLEGRHMAEELACEPPPVGLPFLLRSEARSEGAGRHRPPVEEDAWVTPEELNPTPERSVTPRLDELGRDITALAKQGRLSSVVGRDGEIAAVARYLHRTQKRNVILTGDAGVGKTAIVEGLAQWLVSPEVSVHLQGLRIVQLNVGDLIAGTTYRGDMERRVQEILGEAIAEPDLVLFLDEIHLVMKAGGGGESPLDAANLLKPALAREDFRCIGATTTDEFDLHVRRDAAFARRFQEILVREPSTEATLEICRHRAKRIEAVQGVTIENDAIEAAVTLSTRHIFGQAQPDKALDLLENAAAAVTVSSVRSRQPRRRRRVHIDESAIKVTLQEQGGLGLARWQTLDVPAVRSLLDLELVGQGPAAASLLEALAALAAHDDASQRPLGVLMFTGPSGVGKTHTAECIARALFAGREAAFGRLNMSEYKERHELARLIGAPPGYVGHDQPAALFRLLSASPQGLVLLDEMDKAHREIQDYFLQVFDKGEATDPRGRRANFRGRLIIMTCNVGVDARVGGSDAASAGSRTGPFSAPTPTLREHFGADFLGRADAVIEFEPLAVDDYERLIGRHAEALHRRLSSEWGVALRVDDTVGRHLASCGRAQPDGVRGLFRLFDRKVAGPVFVQLQGKPPPRAIRVELGNGGTIEVTRE